MCSNDLDHTDRFPRKILIATELCVSGYHGIGPHQRVAFALHTPAPLLGVFPRHLVSSFEIRYTE